MAHHPGSYHVQLDVTEAAPQITAFFHKRRVVVVPPKRVGSPLAPIVGPGELSGDPLDPSAEIRAFGRVHQQVHMVAGHTIIQKPQLMLLKMRAQLGSVSVAVAGKLKKE